MTNLKIKAKTIAQFKILEYLKNNYPKLIDNLLIELIDDNLIKITDKNDIAYILYDKKNHEISIFDEKKVFCRKEHI